MESQVSATTTTNARSRPLVWLALAALAATPLACNKAHTDDAAAPPQRRPPPAPQVTDDPGPWVLRYFAPASGQLIIAKKVADVPKGARAQVLVVPDDPALQGPWIYVADLSQAADAGYPVRVVDRFELERQVVASQPPPTEKAVVKTAGAGEVIIYRTAWCGYCEKAAEYLTLKGVPFVEKDLERDAGARQDMLQRASEAGVPGSQLQGVPIIYIKGRILSGFSRQAIDAALGV